MKYAAREIEGELHLQLQEFPIVTVLGPRQAGKTTMVRHALPDYAYVSLEDPNQRALADSDPRGFLATHRAPVIIDEVQRVPDLLSYVQGIVDESNTTGQYVLTGSHQLALREVITQSLAGRTGILHLLPFSIAELKAAGITYDHFSEYLVQGFLPRVHSQQQRPRIAYAAYYQTYVERDVRQLIRLKDQSLFERFIKLLAGRIGQVINYDSLGNDIGVDAKTLKSWISVLEASYIIFKLPSYFNNFGKRVIKAPKYYFTDTGLLAFLLGIETPAQAQRDPLVGNMFENLVVLEVLKTLYNQGRQADLYFFRDSNGNEIDLLHAGNREQLTAVEIKSASTFHLNFQKMLTHFHQKNTPLAQRYIVYNGDPIELSDGTKVRTFRDMKDILTYT